MNSSDVCVLVPKNSDYGAHNQRSHVTVTVETNDFAWLKTSSNLLKKMLHANFMGYKKDLTRNMRHIAYDNPKFVEDMVRISLRLKSK